MRWLIGIGCLFAAGLAAHGQEAEPPKAETPATGLLDEILAQWEHRGASDTLDASFTRVDHNAQFRDDITYEGRILLKKPCFAFINLEKVSVAERVTYERIVWDGKQLHQYLGQTRQIFLYPLRAGEERLGPPSERDSGFLARMYADIVPMLGSLHGEHLPILIDMNVSEAKRYYRMGLEENLPDSAKITLVPLTAGGHDDRTGDTATLRLDKKTYFPTEVTRRSPDGKNTSVYRFTRIARNVPLNDHNFQFKPLRGWQLIDYPAMSALQLGPDTNPARSR